MGSVITDMNYVLYRDEKESYLWNNIYPELGKMNVEKEQTSLFGH